MASTPTPGVGASTGVDGDGGAGTPGGEVGSGS